MADLVFIYSGEHGAFWRPNSAGYTYSKLEAGRYTREEAERIASGCGPEKHIQIRPVDAASDDDILTLQRKAAAIDWLEQQSVIVQGSDGKLIFFRAPGASPLLSYVEETAAAMAGAAK